MNVRVVDRIPRTSLRVELSRIRDMADIRNLHLRYQPDSHPLQKIGSGPAKHPWDRVLWVICQDRVTHGADLLGFRNGKES